MEDGRKEEWGWGGIFLTILSIVVCCLLFFSVIYCIYIFLLFFADSTRRAWIYHHISRRTWPKEKAYWIQNWSSASTISQRKIQLHKSGTRGSYFAVRTEWDQWDWVFWMRPHNCCLLFSKCCSDQCACILYHLV